MSEEIVDIVNEHNIVIKQCARSKMRKERLLHRASYIIIKNHQDYYYIQKRTQLKDYCPSMLDACCGGVMTAGESPDLSALRELEEEMGIKDTPLTFHGWFFHRDGEANVWGAVYSCIYDGPLILQASEVESVSLMLLDEIFAREKEFTPDSIAAIRFWLEKRRNIGSV